VVDLIINLLLIGVAKTTELENHLGSPKGNDNCFGSSFDGGSTSFAFGISGGKRNYFGLERFNARLLSSCNNRLIDRVIFFLITDKRSKM